jgi:hypothetical protein
MPSVGEARSERNVAGVFVPDPAPRSHTVTTADWGDPAASKMSV